MKTKSREIEFQKTEYPERWSEKAHYFGVSPMVFENYQIVKKQTGKWFRIKSSEGVIYRAIRYQPQLSAGKKDKAALIALDYEGSRELGFKKNERLILRLEIRNIYPHEYILAVLKHPDPSYRLASGLGFLALILSIISLLK